MAKSLKLDATRSRHYLREPVEHTLLELAACDWFAVAVGAVGSGKVRQRPVAAQRLLYLPCLIGPELFAVRLAQQQRAADLLA